MTISCSPRPSAWKSNVHASNAQQLWALLQPHRPPLSASCAGGRAEERGNENPGGGEEGNADRAPPHSRNHEPAKALLQGKSELLQEASTETSFPSPGKPSCFLSWQTLT